MSDREIQQELRSTEHSTRLQPRLCALRPSPAREEHDQQGSEQRTSQENIRNVQEARNSSASGRTPPPGERVSEAEGPGGLDHSLEAPNSTVFEVEAANASHGVWGRIQMRLPAVFRGGREWLGGEAGQPEEVHYTNTRVTQEAMDTGTYDMTRPPMVVTSEGIRTLRPEEVDMETQTIRLIPNERLVVKTPPPAKRPPVPPPKQPPVPFQPRGYGGATSSGSSRPSEAAERGQAAMASSKAMGTAMGYTSKAAGTVLQGVSKSAAAARSSSSTGPPTLERMRQPATDRPWNRPGKAPPAQLLMPVGGLMDDQLEFQNSVFWTPEILNDIQDLIEEEALLFNAQE